MEDIRIVRINNSPEHDELRYKFFLETNGNNDWKEKYKRSCSILRKKYIEQQDMSDYEYYLKIHPFIEQNDHPQFYLMVDNEPVTLIKVGISNVGIADITVYTIPKQQRKGYASKSIELLEKVLFANTEIQALQIVDQSNFGQSTKIAIKNGFIPLEDGSGIFIKKNPAYIPEEAQTQGVKL